MRLALLLDWNITVGVLVMFPSRSGWRKRKSGNLCRHKKDGGQPAAVFGEGECSLVQTRRVSTKFWPLELVQLSWLVETIRQLKLTAVWRISDVPLICTDVAPVIV